MDENPILDDPPSAEAKLRGGATKAGAFQWTPEAVRRLQTLWMEGRSGSEIAERLGGGLTRSAVLGKLHRLQHPSPRIRVLSKRKKLNRRKTKPGSHLKPGKPPSAPPPILAKVRLPRPLRGDIKIKPLGERANLMELHPLGCKWPVARKDEMHIFCNRWRLSEQPYCQEHTAASYVGGR